MNEVSDVGDEVNCNEEVIEPVPGSTTIVLELHEKGNTLGPGNNPLNSTEDVTIFYQATEDYLKCTELNATLRLNQTLGPKGKSYEVYSNAGELTYDFLTF